MASTTHAAEVESDDDSIETLTRAQALELLDRQARKFLGMSGAEFVRRYRAGEIADPHRLDVVRVAMLLPLAEF